MQLSDLTANDQIKATELSRMKRLATGLLLLMMAVYIVCRFFHGEYFWLEFIEATSEAAMVGALADWFAVTALFRYPMGLKIPHTAIIPRKKDAIATQFGEFVQNNFLSEDVISEKVKSMALSKRVAAWMSEEKNAEEIATQVTAGLAGVVKVMNDKDIQTLIEDKISDKIQETSFSPMMGDLLSFVTSGSRQQALFDAIVKAALGLLEDSDADIKETVKKESPWWFPSSMDKAVYHKIVRGVSKSLYEMQMDIYHPLRVRLLGMSTDFMEDLKHSDDIHEKEASIKKELLEAPAIREFTGTLWADIKAALLKQSENPDTELKKAIKDAVIQFANTILEDEKLAAKIDGWADDSARYLIRNYGHEVAKLIAATIEKWDPEMTSQRIELQIGKDLQFIRINGTVVGGLAGLSIFSIDQAVGYFLAQ